MPKTTGPEAELYPPVERWAARRAKCWEVARDTGPSLGRIDVVGVRDFGGGDLASRSEVIAVEVKLAGQPFAKSAGQAHGYSVMADRCYLAQRTDGYRDEQLVVASRLGIGLLSISAKGRVAEVLSAPVQDPLPELRLQLLAKLGCGVCALCATVFRLGNGPKSFANVSRRTSRAGLANAARNERGYMWWLQDASGERDWTRAMTYWRRYLCRDCVDALGGE